MGTHRTMDFQAAQLPNKQVRVFNSSQLVSEYLVVLYWNIVTLVQRTSSENNYQHEKYDKY